MGIENIHHTSTSTHDETALWKNRDQLPVVPVTPNLSDLLYCTLNIPVHHMSAFGARETPGCSAGDRHSSLKRLISVELFPTVV